MTKSRKMCLTSAGGYFVFFFFAANFFTFIKCSFACDASSDHALEVVNLLNVTVRSEATKDPGKTPSTNGLAYIEVNGKNYAPQTKGYNVAVFDALSGRFLTSAAFDCVGRQGECDKLGTFLNRLPEDTIILIAIQESAYDSGRTLPTGALHGVGAQNAGSVVANSSYAVIGYKGNKSVDWKDEVFKANGTGPAEVLATIPITFSYIPLVSTTCSPVNVASQKYGGSCLNQSSRNDTSTDCKYVVDGNSTSGWKSIWNRFNKSHIQIGFHTVFTISKLRIQQDVATGRQIQDILLEFSDCSNVKITLAADNPDFQEFTFLSRRASWVKFTVKKVYGSSGSVGIREIEIYNDLCKQKTLCDAVHLGNNSVSLRYHLHRPKFPFMVDAKDQVHVLLTSESRATSSRYEIVIGSEKNTAVKLRRIKDGQSEELMMANVASPLKGNEMRSFWIDMEKERVLFGSGEKVYLFWRDADPINVKYVFFSTTSSLATFHMCGRIDQCYTDADHYWPLDKSVIFVQDLKKERIGKIHGPWTMQGAHAKVGFAPLAIALGGSNSWIDHGDFPDSCISSPSKCPDGISVSFKARVTGSRTGYILSSGGVAIYYVNETMNFIIQDKDKVWEVEGPYKKYVWETFAMSWSRENGLTAVIVGAAANVLRDLSGKSAVPSAVLPTSLTIGRPNGENATFAQGAIRDVALWKKEISEERMSSLHVCNDPETCAAGWEFFDGSCYKLKTTNLSASAARDACLSETANLVKITSKEENTFVSTLAAGEAWIGLEKNARDGLLYWKDGMRNSYSNWTNGPLPLTYPCVVIEADGGWRTVGCTLTSPKYVCEQVRYHELGCYQDSTSSPAFVFNPGGYNSGSMTPGLCMHECGTWYYKYAALKNGHLCLCSNSTSPAADRASDMCSSPCLGSGNLKCGGEENHISVYKSVDVRPLSLSMSLDSSVLTLSTFNTTLMPSVPPDQAVEFYTIKLGHHASYYTTQPYATLPILYPGLYYIRGRATVKHNHTGYRSVVESSAMLTAITNLTDLEIFCPTCAPINVTVNCSMKFRHGSDVKATIQFEDGKDPVSGFLPDAPVMTVGIPVGEGGSPVTSDGLYLLAGEDIPRKGKVVALELDIERGGALEVKVYRPKCVDPGQRYCRSQKMCISDNSLCTESATKNCDSDELFSFSGSQCARQNMSCCQNKIMDYGNVDYEEISSFMAYTISGPKRIFTVIESQQLQLEPGDAFGVRFPTSGPAAALKTSSAGFSFFYSSSVLNRTGSDLLRGNRLPSTEDNPTQVLHTPAIALVFSTDSESHWKKVYEAVGHENIFLSVGNSIFRVNYTKSICLQETITGLQLNLSKVYPFAEPVSITGSVDQGTNVTYIWHFGKKSSANGTYDFGEKSNSTTLTPWVTHEFYSTGYRTLKVMAGNRIGVFVVWCVAVIQQIGLRCVFNCDSKLNPASKFSLQGKGKSKGDLKWNIKHCNNSEAQIRCTDVTEGKLQKFSWTPLTSDSLVIKPYFFEAGGFYKVILQENVAGGKTRRSTYLVPVNEPPTYGTCYVTPKEGKPLEPMFHVSCEGFYDKDMPLKYEFFYKKDLRPKGRLETLGSGMDSFRSQVSLPSGLAEYDYKLKFYVVAYDKLGASKQYEIPQSVAVEKIDFTVHELEEKARELDKLAATGNIKETANVVSSIALVLNEQTTEEKNQQDIEGSIQLRTKLVGVVVRNANLTAQTNLEDVAQIGNTIRTTTVVTKEVSPGTTRQVSSFAENASKVIFQQAIGKGALSEIIKNASEAVFGAAVNCILSVNTSQTHEQSLSKTPGKNESSWNVTQKALDTVNTLAAAIAQTMIPGEEAKTMETESLAVGIKKEDAENIGKQPIKTGGSIVTFPDNFTAFSNISSSVEQVSMVSAINMYSGVERAELVNSKLVSLAFYTLEEGERRYEHSVSNLTEKISVILPRSEKEGRPTVVQAKLHSDKYKLHRFTVTENTSTVHIRVGWQVSVEVELYLKKGSEPKPAEGVYDFNVTFQDGENRCMNSSNSSEPSISELFLSNDDLNWTAAGMYYAFLRYKGRASLPEEKAKMDSDGAISHNFSVYTSMCMYFDEKRGVWSTEGTEVGPKTSLTFTECLTSHLTTFGGRSFFVPPNKINFDKLSSDDLRDSPHALITVCVILALYLICLIPARRADRNDALKTGVSPLPDNDSRDTYYYEIQVHTGFVRGAGTTADVSIVLTGGLGDSEPRVLKDPDRKLFKKGSVDAFLLSLPQSLGNLKHIRVWHNNCGKYPSWNLLRIMIQDIQADQRWWFVCDDWLAVDESDGKVEQILYPATKKELTKFNVLFTSEVRKNLSDGHIWFSVLARPWRSTFTRVQRLTCCLSILMCTMVANAMFYRVAENETPKYSIRIMGFSFSIRQVSIGIVSSLIVFPANLIVVTIFRKAKPKENRYTVKTEGSALDDADIEAAKEKNKAPMTFALPHWFVFIAYGIAFVATCTSASFVIMYGMEFGSEKSAQWLLSMSISFLQDVLFIQPMKVFILATLFALLVKDPKKAEEDSFTDANALANDEEWPNKNTEDLDPEKQKMVKQLINDKPPDEAKLEMARKLRMKEKQMMSIIREILWYVIFLLVLLTISYGNRDLTTSKVTKHMQDIFEKAAYSGNLTYKKVHGINHYWTWMSNTFIPSLTPQLCYNNLTPYDSGFLADTPTAWLLGVARLRQLRIKKDTCTFKQLFLHFIKECNDFYSKAGEDQGLYLPGWKVKPSIPYQNVSLNPTTTPTEMPHVKGPWEYQTGEELGTFPYWGSKAIYGAGGYVQMVPRGEIESSKVIGNLREYNWLDRYTRAIFSEFATYNANVNLFCVVTLLFEQLPTGSLTPYPSILTLRLFRYVGGEMYIVLACEITYFLFCSFFVFKEIRLFVKKGREHLKNPWSILEIVVTLLSLSAVGLYFARMTFTKKALEAMKRDRKGFVSFHYTAFLDEWLKCIMGIIVFLSFLKMFRLLRFNRRMSTLQQVLKRSFSQLLSFMVIFALAFLAFALFACLVFGQSMEGFGTFWRSCASLMDTLLGKFTFKEMSKANRIIGPIFFYSYTVSMVFILINMFLSIINDAFTEVRSDVEKQSNDYEIADFMIHRFKEIMGRSISPAILPVYKEPKTELELNFDKIADKADNAMHSMRNVAFEDMRKMQWFQCETSAEKKKNLMRLLMAVDWDFDEDELCDSIPVLERFLNQHSDEKLDTILQCYRQQSTVEDLSFKEINVASDSSEGSDSESDESSGSNCYDEESSNDESDFETESVVKDGIRLLKAVFSAAPQSVVNHPGSAVKVKTPALLMTVVDATTMEQQQLAEGTDRKRSFVDEAVSDNELLKILDDVQRDAESRCATDAELNSILYGDTLSYDDTKWRLYSSDPETTIGKKNAAKKKRKKKREETPKEKTIKEGWITEADNKRRDGEPDVDREKKKKVKKEENRKKSHVMQSDEDDEEYVKHKKKAKVKFVTEDKGEMEAEKNKKKKKMRSEEDGGNQTSEDKGKKKKKQKTSKEETTAETGVKVSMGSEEKKEEKKKKGTNVGMATSENEEDEINENEENKRKKANKEEATADIAIEEDGHDKTKEGEEKPGKKKKNREAAEESRACDEELNADEEKLKKEKKKDQLEKMCEDNLELCDTDKVETKKKKKKKGKAKMKLASEEDEGQSSVKMDETGDGKEKKKRKRKISVWKESES